MPNNDILVEAEKGIIREILTEDIAERWKRSQEILASLSQNIQFHTIPAQGTKPFPKALLSFLKLTQAAKG